MSRRNSSFYWAMARAVLDPPEVPRWRACVLGVLLISASAAAFAHYTGGPTPAQAREVPNAAPDFPKLTRLTARAERAERRWTAVERYYRREVAPIRRVLLEYRDAPQLTRRIALSLVREARRVGIEPRVLLAVMLVENPWLDPDARSFVGAVGLMQVMPFHEGNWPACPGGLESIPSNICYGASIFAHYLRAENGDIEEALLRYNGCVNGTNTPHCHRYPQWVYARAGRASLYAWLKPKPARIVAR